MDSGCPRAGNMPLGAARSMSHRMRRSRGCRSTNQRRQLQEPQGSAPAAVGEAPAAGTREPGYIATLKDNYGFITCASLPCLIRDALP